MSKPYFKFYDENGEIQDGMDLSPYKDDTALYDKLLEQRIRFYLINGSDEKKWRNSELDATDKLLLPDSTYGGEIVGGSYMYDGIMKYRSDLRAYKYDTEEDRPVRPDWYNG